jgi:hypothetical protein
MQDEYTEEHEDIEGKGRKGKRAEGKCALYSNDQKLIVVISACPSVFPLGEVHSHPNDLL